MARLKKQLKNSPLTVISVNISNINPHSSDDSQWPDSQSQDCNYWQAF